MLPIPTNKLRTPEAAAFLNVSVSTLTKWRVYGCGPEFEKLGARIVVYDFEALRQFASSRRRSSTTSSTNAA